MERRSKFSRRRGFKDDFETKLLDITRVARVVKGGRRFGFRTLVAVGNKKGKLGIGLAQANDVSAAIEKASHQAKKRLIDVPVVNREIAVKFKAAKIELRPRSQGLLVGGVLRQICRVAGIENLSAKMRGSGNKVNNARAFMKA